MGDYRIGYEYYKQACQQHGLEPINFHYYILNLSQEQLDAYNERAEQKRGRDIEN
ncbi:MULTISPECIES: transcriptional regulator [Lysinibacillus]|uniref:Transcriptional regulator n=1 Tax=Lysinibacillus antri TaxID=2498145 RepID=A0A432LCN1_9BACI|nr:MULTISPECIES: transcriptional regulator [Lysinibacillus]RUL53934.1 transcriptional regulator [Lysinibacillus antri]TSI09731.1 transcriptional regulator [Lysinibacillus sp. BW-2-10]